MVEHTGKVIENVPKEAKQVLKWLRRVKPDFFKKNVGKCKAGTGKGTKGGGTALGILSYLLMLPDIYEAQKLADESGLSVWTIMSYGMLGVEIGTDDDWI
jgi:hypothetical protein